MKDRVCDLVRSLYNRCQRLVRAQEAGKIDAKLNILKLKPTWQVAFKQARNNRGLVLQELPHAIPFEDRVNFFQEEIVDSQNHQVKTRMHETEIPLAYLWVLDLLVLLVSICIAF